LDTAVRSHETRGGKNVPKPISSGQAGWTGTVGNEVNPTHRPYRKVMATRAQATAMVEGAEEEAKSEGRTVMVRIGAEDGPAVKAG